MAEKYVEENAGYFKYVLAEALNAPVVLVGFSPPDANIHCPNEKFLFKEGLLAGTRSAIYSLEEIAKIGGKNVNR